jgi:hypothetical protein
MSKGNLDTRPRSVVEGNDLSEFLSLPSDRERLSSDSEPNYSEKMEKTCGEALALRDYQSPNLG